MKDVGAYLLPVSVAAILCGLAGRIPGTKGASAAMKLFGALLLTLTLLRPLKTLSLDFSAISVDGLRHDAAQAVSQGEKISANEMAQIIKDQTAAYILQEAQTLHVQLRVDVEVSDDEVPIPVGVKLSGTVSPYARAQLQHMIEHELGISKEKQQWT